MSLASIEWGAKPRKALGSPLLAKLVTDIPLLLTLVAVAAVGLVVLYSAVGEDTGRVVRQGVRAGLGLAATIAAAEPAPDLERLIARHVEARGGAAAIEAVRTFDSEIRIVEPTFEVDGTYVATREGRMRVDIRMDGERVFTEALDRERAWSWTPDGGVRDGSAAGAAALRHGIE